MGTRDGRASSRGSRQGRHAGALPAARPGLCHVRRQHRIGDDAHRPDIAAHRDAEPRSHLPADLDGRPRARAEPEPVVDGLLGWTLGGRHAGRRELRLPPRNLADWDGHPHTEQLRLTERYRRPSFGKLETEVTFADPGVYARPWTVKVVSEDAADTEMLEWVCNEGASRSLVHWAGKASDERRNEVKVSPAVLARYIGTYDEQPPFWRSVQITGASQASGRTVQITVEDGRLVGEMDGRGKQELIAASNTEFSGLYGLGVQFIDGGLFVKHVSGTTASPAGDFPVLFPFFPRPLPCQRASTWSISHPSLALRRMNLHCRGSALVVRLPTFGT